MAQLKDTTLKDRHYATGTVLEGGTYRVETDSLRAVVSSERVLSNARLKDHVVDGRVSHVMRWASEARSVSLTERFQTTEAV